MDKLELEREKRKLKETLKIIFEQADLEKHEIEELYDKFIGSREELWAEEAKKKVHLKNLEMAKDKPYFARLDFVYDNGEEQVIYIGKNGVMTNQSDIIVTDWRAPISSLYYDAEIGNVSFETPAGIVDGIMKLKRQFEINKGELEDYFDLDLVSNDALLEKYLNANNDARLKSIVSTIQKEQNEVIRKNIYDNLIIQGVAGSGKTTVALHRIAYLVYNYMKTIKQSEYLVIGPNPVFLKYIKSVLPELDVASVEQSTFEDFTKKYMDLDITINPSDKKVNDSISGKISNNVDKFKCSIRYKDMIEMFLNEHINNMTCNDIKLDDFVVIPSSDVRAIFDSTETSFSTTLDSRIEITINRLVKYIENHEGEIVSRFSAYSFERFKVADDKEKSRKELAKLREELGKGCKSTIRKYFSKAKLDPVKAYKKFVMNIENYDIYNYEFLPELKKETLKCLKANTYDFEDLAALLFIKEFISLDKGYAKVKHVVIDEAQDLGDFNFYALHKALPSATFSIFGDLAQSIYDYRGIESWEDVNNIMFNNEGNIINFNKSYRTTAEIMDTADDVADVLGLNRSDLVIRHGAPVNITEFEKSSDIPSYVMDKVKEYVDKGYKKIAIISKTSLMSNYMNDDLNDLGMKIPNIGLDDDLSSDEYDICTISNQLVKGLEFDAVIINDAGEHIYSSENRLDMKLLYVALTRALHELDIVYTGELTKPLQKTLIKKK